MTSDPASPDRYDGPQEEDAERRRGGGTLERMATLLTGAVLAGAVGGVLATGGTLVDRGAVDLDVVARSTVVVNGDGGQSGTAFGIGGGHLLTSAHVLGDGDTTVTLTDRVGRDHQASVVGVDRTGDIAVLRAEQDVTSILPLRDLAEDPIRIGETVHAVGTPFGLPNTLTSGVVSGTGRTIPPRTNGRTGPGGDTAILDLIQTDAALNPGNSGGVLVDRWGRVVGMVTAIASSDGGDQGAGFAIPVDTLLRVSDQLISSGTYTYPRLGVGVTDTEAGAAVGTVEPGSAAEAAGISEGDVIVAVDGEAVASAAALVRSIRDREVGGAVRITILRDGTARDLRITLGGAAG